MKEPEGKNGKYYLSVFIRGMAMGAADVIPGVSGGTIAFITGIYTDLIDSLRSCDHKAVKCLLQEGVPSAWRHINGTFLLAVFGGILVSIFSLAKLMTYCLETQPILVWALFFGLILSSSLLLLQQVPGWNVRRVLLFVGGAAFVIGVSLIKPTQLPDEWWVVFSAGMIAICAMILPGISGGFLLLMMGLYSTIIGAVSSFNFAILIPLGIGCLIGLLLFSHVLSWLLHHFEAATMAFLTGVLIGSLKIIWPWKQTLETVIDRHGDTVPLVQANILPNHYTVMTGEPSQLVSAILMCLIGICLVGGMAFLASRRQKLN